MLFRMFDTGISIGMTFVLVLNKVNSSVLLIGSKYNKISIT